MKLLMSFTNTVKRMSILDITIYKLMLTGLGLALANYIPWLGTLDPFIYVGLAALFLIPVALKTYKPRKNTSGIVETALENFHHFKFSDIWLFECGMVFISFTLYFFIPELRIIDPLRRVSLFLFGSGWMMGMWAHQK